MLVARIVQRDESALAALYDRYAGMLSSVLNRILRDTQAAEEILQDIFYQLWRTAPQFDPARGSLPGWLLVIARNRAISRLRRHNPASGEELMDNTVIVPANLESVVAQQQLLGKVKSAMESLPKEQRATLELAYYEGLTHSEIAAAHRRPARHRKDAPAHRGGNTETEFANMSGQHPTRPEDFDLYALGALDPDEKVVIEAHVASCPDCAQKVAEAQGRMALLAFAAPRVEPSPGVKEILMRRLHATAEGPGGSLARSEPEPAGGIFGRWWAVLLPLSGALALATILLWLHNAQLDRQLAGLRSTIAAQQKQLDDSRHMADLLAARDTIVVPASRAKRRAAGHRPRRLQRPRRHDDVRRHSSARSCRQGISNLARSDEGRAHQRRMVHRLARQARPHDDETPRRRSRQRIRSLPGTSRRQAPTHRPHGPNRPSNVASANEETPRGHRVSRNNSERELPSRGAH